MSRNTFSREPRDMRSQFERGSYVGTRAVCGYLQKRWMMTSGEVAALRQQILECAAENGLTVDKIFEEDLDRTFVQLSDCVFALLDGDERVMIVPDLSHFAGLGNPLLVRDMLKVDNVKVICARPRPPQIDIDPLEEV